MRQVVVRMSVKILALTFKPHNLKEEVEETLSATGCVDTSEKTQNQKLLTTVTPKLTKPYAGGSVGLVLTGSNN